MKKLYVVAVIVGALAAGCGTPSKSDVCGDCKGSVKEACEIGYDICDGDGDCIDALDEGLSC